MAAKRPNDGDRRIRPKTVIRNSGGKTVQITEDVLLQNMDTYHPEWRVQTLTIPCIPDLKYEGPIGLPGPPEKTEQSHRGHVKGQETEAKVLKIYQEFSQKNNLHWKIFHDVHVNNLKWKELTNIFGGTETFDEQLEVDFVVVDGSSIILTEVKSKLINHEKPIGQLKNGESFILKLLKIVGISSSEVRIKKVIAAPGPFCLSTETIADTNNCILLNINDPKCCQTLQSSVLCERKTVLNKLIAALAFLKCCTKLHSFKLALREGAKGKELSDSLTHHKHLEKWRHPGVEKSKDLYVWLDPIQVEIMKDKDPIQIIIGPASTGKTILIQLKIIEKLKNNEPVIVILPSSALVLKYRLFFENCNQEKLCIITPDEKDWPSIQRKTKAHVFIDEYCVSALEHKEFEDEIKKLAKLIIESPSSPILLWITMDFKQGLESKWEFPSSKGVCFLESGLFPKSHLVMFHRCTKNVLLNYRDFCGSLADIGHQNQGEPTKDVITKPKQGKNPIKVWAEKVKKTYYDEQTKKGWKEEDIAIIIVVENADSALLFLELKSIMGTTQIHFETDTLSQEWPVVILCLEGQSSKLRSYVAFSRAIFKVINVLKPEGGGSEAGDDRFRQFTLSLLGINICNRFIFRSILVEMVGFFQLARTQSEMHIVRHLKIDLDNTIKKLNSWIFHLIAENKDQVEVICFKWTI